MKAKWKFLTRPRDEQGLALISVLWALSILSLIAAAALSSANLSYRMERNTLRQVQAELLAQAAINRAVLALTDTRADQRWRVDGVAQEYSFAGARMKITVQDEAGKIDLNNADRDLIKRLFVSAGLASSQADAMTDRVIDWRTPSADKHLNGANAADYAAAGYAYRPRNAPFQSVDELKLVMGMTPQLYARIAPGLTVYTRRTEIDVAVAPKEALLALPGMDEQKANDIIAARVNPNGSLATQSSGLPAGVTNPATPLNGRVFSIAVEVEDGKRHVSLQTVLLITGDPKRPYLTLALR